jgi:hypothetical protein
VNPPDPYSLAQETQGVLLIVLLIGAGILGRKRGIGEVFAWFGISAALRLLVDDSSKLWAFYVPAGVGVLSSYWFILCLLLLNLAFVYRLVGKTGGSELSSYTPLYLMMPTFALLIFGVRIEVFLYAACALFCFGLTLFTRDEDWHKIWISDAPDYLVLVRRTRLANLWFSTACLGLVILIDHRNATLRSAGVEHARVSPPAAHPSPPVAPPRAESPTPTSTRSSEAIRPKKERSTPAPVATPIVRAEPTITPRESSLIAPSPQATLAAAVVPVNPPAAVAPAFSAHSSPREERSRSSSEKSALHSYPVFLTKFYSPKLSPRQRTKYLRENRGSQVDWEVKFERRVRRGGEILVYFGRTDEVPLPSVPPVILAKIMKTRAGDIEKCSRGDTIRVIGRLQRNSPSQLFVQASEIRRQ